MSSGRDLDPIKQVLDKSCKCLQEKFGDAELIITHFLYGETTTPGAIRKSAMNVKRDVESGDMRSNDEVLQNHIRILDRANTFLSMIEDWVIHEQTDSTTDSLSLTISQNPSTRKFSLLFKKEHQANSRIRYNLILHKRVIENLCPKVLGKEYFDRLYSSELKDEDADLYKKRFLLCRADTFGKVNHEDKDVKDVINNLASEGEGLNSRPYNERLWEFLEGLQSALLYFLKYGNEEWEFAYKATIIIYNYNIMPGMMVAILLIPKDKPLNNNNKDEVVEILKTTYGKIYAVLDRESNYPAYDFNLIRFQDDSGKSKGRFEEKIKKLFPLKSRTDVALTLGHWVLCLLQALEGRIHEGHALDFWFVIGDFSQFADCKRIKFRSFNKLQCDDPEDTENCLNRAIFPLDVPCKYRIGEEKVIEQAANFLAREHFPWFQGGKYALFWDVSRVYPENANLRPYGLISISGSSWEQYLKQSYTNDQPINIPASIFGFTKGKPNDTGLIITTTDDNGNPILERTLHYREKKWRFSGTDGRENALEALIKLQAITTEEERQKIVKLCLRVADNPLEGGTLILLEKGANKEIFVSMGIPWKFGKKIEDDDIEALMSHDGATVVQRTSEATQWDFRLLLSAYDISSKYREKIVSAAKNYYENNCPLFGSGARRWSAAIASLHPKVKGIVVISQDGDISYWQREGCQQVTMYHLPQGMADIDIDIDIDDLDRLKKGTEYFTIPLK